MIKLLDSLFGSERTLGAVPTDEEDIIVELKDIPRSDTGAPMPVVFSDEHTTLLGYTEQEFIDWSTARPEDIRGSSTIIEFKFCASQTFGSPNDEAIHGHPLHKKGLKSYSAVEVVKSSWIKKLERMNSVHDRHDPKRFERYRHFIFTFHDSMFECVAESYSVCQMNCTYLEMLMEMHRQIGAKGDQNLV